jgi:hypothetical protein
MRHATQRSSVNISDNNVTSVGPIFCTFANGSDFCEGLSAGATQLLATTAVWIDLSKNHIENYKLALYSYKASAPLTLGLDSNNITSIGDNVLDFWSAQTAATALTLTMAYNPITYISNESFFGLGRMAGLRIDVSYPTAGPIIFPQRLIFDSGEFYSGVTWVFAARHTGATIETVATFDTFLLPKRSTGVVAGCGNSCNFTLDLSFNNITSIHANALATAGVTKLILRHTG